MDLFFYFYPIAWYCWDILNNIILVSLIRHWVKGSVFDTKDQVLAELKKPATALEVKAAMEIPDKKDLEALKTCMLSEVWELRKRFQGVQEAVQGVQDVRDALADIRSLNGKLEAQAADLKALEGEMVTRIDGIKKLEITLDEETIKKLGRSSAGYQGKQGQVDAQVIRDQVLATYQGNPEAFKQDATVIYQQLTQIHGVPPTVAQNAINQGPEATLTLFSAFLGKKKERPFILFYAQGIR